MGSFPHSVTVDLGIETTATGARFLPSVWGESGRVKDFTFEVSRDGSNWTAELSDRLKNKIDFFTFKFKKPVRMRYWRFTAKSGYSGSDCISMGEISVLGE